MSDKRNAPYLPRDPIADKDGYVRSTAWTAWFTFLSRLFKGDPRNATMTWVSGTPEGNIAASPGSLAAVTDAGAGALYVKATGTDNVGWVSAAGVTTVPGGADTQVQFNNATAFGGDSGLTYNKTTDILSVGSGIAFPAVQVPVTNANTFDDYEEGLWTPTDASGAALALTLSASNNVYVKLGRIVILSYLVTYPITADVSVALLGGLPFTVATSTNAVWANRVGYSTETTLQVLSVNQTTTQWQPLISTGGTITNATLSTDTLRGILIYYASA